VYKSFAAMKKISYIIAITILLFTIFSCEKQKDDRIPPDYLVIDTSSTDYTYKAVVGKEVYASLWGSNLMDYTIDLNNDGTDDIQFSCSVYHHTVYDEWNAIVKTLNENVALDVEKDTILFANYSIEYITPSGFISIIYNENYIPSKPYPSNLTVDTHIYDFPVVHSISDSLNQFCNWKSGTFVLEYDDHHSGEIQNNIQTGTWRSIDHKFIGIRFSEKSIPYYGWIELGVNDYHITLYKYAVRM
jgi:hypothetical protein